MSDTLSAAAAALRRSSELLGEVGRRLGQLDAGPEAFGADAPGALGELGHRLHMLSQRAVRSRAHEAGEHSGHVEELGDAVRRASQRYAEADDAAGRRGV